MVGDFDADVLTWFAAALGGSFATIFDATDDAAPFTGEAALDTVGRDGARDGGPEIELLLAVGVFDATLSELSACVARNRSRRFSRILSASSAFSDIVRCK